MQNCFYTRHTCTEEAFKKNTLALWSSNLPLWYTEALSSPLPLGFQPTKRALHATWPEVRQLLRAPGRLSSVDYSKPTLLQLITSILNPVGLLWGTQALDSKFHQDGIRERTLCILKVFGAYEGRSRQDLAIHAIVFLHIAHLEESLSSV